MPLFPYSLIFMPVVFPLLIYLPRSRLLAYLLDLSTYSSTFIDSQLVMQVIGDGLMACKYLWHGYYTPIMLSPYPIVGTS